MAPISLGGNARMCISPAAITDPELVVVQPLVQRSQTTPVTRARRRPATVWRRCREPGYRRAPCSISAPFSRYVRASRVLVSIVRLRSDWSIVWNSLCATSLNFFNSVPFSSQFLARHPSAESNFVIGHQNATVQFRWSRLTSGKRCAM